MIEFSPHRAPEKKTLLQTDFSSSEKRNGPHGLLYILVSILGFCVGWCLSQTTAESGRKTTSTEDTLSSPNYFAPVPMIESLVANAGPIPPDTGKTNRHKDDTPFWKDPVAVGTIGLLFVNVFLAWSTYKAADAAKQSAASAYYPQRPWIFVKMAGGFHLEVGKPVTADIEVWNYSNSPALGRAEILVDVGQGIVEKFRNELSHNKSAYVDRLDGLTLLIAPQGKPEIAEFPIQSKHQIANQRELDEINSGLTAGTIDVAAFGRIVYSDLRIPMTEQSPYSFSSIFCYHLLPDGTTSACPNREHAFTNWMQ